MALVAPDVAFAARKHRSSAKRRVSVESGLSDPRYADLVMDPVTGEVYHQQDPDGQRHPASLTKMMTLYLLFKALDEGKISMNTRMEVSSYAASMPQTNLALQPGDTIPVEIAIKSIVVRSANDVAVVIAETLGGSEDNFADRMTQQARLLGMKNTVFHNANGLPDGGQHTTARDMAKLGIALKRDFPRYYPYFSTREFSWQGVTYYTHNRVMLRYSGVDGIKTGYIGTSGFNLVTSVTHGGRPLIGVVLGGISGRWRDDRMIALLNQSYSTLASRGQKRGVIYAANLPRTQAGVEVAPEVAASNDQQVRTNVSSPPTTSNDDDDTAATATTTTTTTTTTVVAPATSKVPASSPFAVVSAPVAKPAAAVAKPTGPMLPSGRPAPATAKPATNPLPTPLAAAKAKQVTYPTNSWGIQVGAFSTKALAEQAAKQAIQLGGVSLKGSKITVDANNAATVHRARLENISENQARKACEALISNNSPCFIYKAGAQNL